MNGFARAGAATAGLLVLLGLAYHQGRIDQATGEEDTLLVGTAIAASGMATIEGDSPTRSLPGNDAYFPGRKELAMDEMRFVACVSYMPNAWPRQAADPGKLVGLSDYLHGGSFVFQEVVRIYYDPANEICGADFEPPK